MSEQRTEFDKWFDDYEHNNDIRLAINYGAYEIAGDAWQAATAEANKRIEALESEVAAFEAISFVQMKQIDELQARNNDLREALKTIAIESHEELWQREFAFKALSATPAESLQAHDNEVIEKCAKVCDGYIKATFFAHNIRALKQEVK